MRSRLVPLFLCAAVLVAGCRKTSNTSVVAPASPVQAAGPPPTEEECRQFAADLESAVKTGDTAKISALLRMDDLLLRSFGDLDSSADFQRQLRQRIQAVPTGENFFNTLIGVVKQGGSYKFRTYHQRGAKPHVLFRMHQEEQGVNYHDIALVRHSDNRVAMEDMYVLLTGEMLSQTIKRPMLALLPAINPDLVSRLTGRDRDYLDNLKGVQGIAVANRAGRPDDAIAAYRKLPESLRKEKTILFFYLSAAKMKGDSEYAAALEAFQTYHRNDASLDMVLLDHFILKKEYDTALKSVDRLGPATHNDSYLFVIRSNVLAAAGRQKEAAVAAEKAAEMEAELNSAYESRISIALQEKNHDDTFRWLCQYVEKCGVEIDDLTKLPDYADFVKSPKYGEWTKWYQEHKK